jgi:tRNA modification GTPase
VSPVNPQVDEDTIAAISTPQGAGAIAVVRLSGPDAIAIAGRLFAGRVFLPEAAPRTVHSGRIVSESAGTIDEVLATMFRGPHSYTGEDMVEISCHGGPLPAALVLEAAMGCGARPAGPGEFTKRAFLSGRIDLSQAEAVAEIIAAKSRAGLKAALAQLEGALSGRVSALRERLAGALAEIEARLDFSEDVDEPLHLEAIGETICAARADAGRLLEAGEMGRLAREGARVVIAGPPNVGKSRLLNALVGADRAIVTPVPGTTRDTIEEWVEMEGVLLTLADTAGLRPTTDFVEMEGVRRARAMVRESQLVLAVFEAPSPPSEDDMVLVNEMAKHAPVLPVVNKTDLGGDKAGWAGALEGFAEPVFTSALTEDGVPGLKRRIVECLIGGAGDHMIETGEVLLTNARHMDAIRRVCDALERTASGLGEGLSEELLAFELRGALDALGEITGESADEDVLGRIFSSFCVGK